MGIWGDSPTDWRVAGKGFSEGVDSAIEGWGGDTRPVFDQIKAQNAQRAAMEIGELMKANQKLSPEIFMEIGKKYDLSQEDMTKMLMVFTELQKFGKERGQEGMQQDILRRATGTDRQDIERTIAGLPVEKRVSAYDKARTQKTEQDIEFGPEIQQRKLTEAMMKRNTAIEEQNLNKRKQDFVEAQAGKPKQKDTQAYYKLGLMKRAAKGEELNYTEKKLIGLHLNSYIIEATKMTDKDFSLVGLTTAQQIAHIIKTAEKLKLAHEGKGGKIKPLDPVGFRDVIK